MRKEEERNIIMRPKAGADPARQKRGHEYGLRSAARLSPEEHIIRASLRGNATLQRYGIEYYKAMGKLSAERSRAKRNSDG